MELVSAGLGANATSGKWECTTGMFIIDVRGTFSAQTVTLQSSPTSGTGANFTDFAVRDGSGTVAALAFAEAERIVVAGAGQFFQAIVSNGGSPSISVYVEPFNSGSVVKVL